MPWVGFFYWQEDTARGLDEEGPYTHAARGGDGGHEGRQSGYYDFHDDFDDVFLFGFHNVLFFKWLIFFIRPFLLKRKDQRFKAASIGPPRGCLTA